MKPEILRILTQNTYVTLGTVCQDGAPWNSPVRFAFDEQYIYWMSANDATHSQNMTRDKRVFLSVFNSTQNPEPGTRGALYISTNAQALAGSEELEAHNIFADRFYDVDKLGEQETLYRAPIGALDEARSQEQRFYFKSDEEAV